MKGLKITARCPQCSGTMEEHKPNCPSLRLPPHAKDGHTEAMAVIYKRALVIETVMKGGDFPKALHRQITDILVTCRHYLQPSRVQMMDHEQRRAANGDR